MEPTNLTSQERKDTPVFSGVLRYFPKAMFELARLSKAGNDKHNPGQPLHWARGKSTDHGDCIIRHQIEAGMIDPDDGFPHDSKVAWRALAQLEEYLEEQERIKDQKILESLGIAAEEKAAEISRVEARLENQPLLSFPPCTPS
tara:strand:- start:25 stop:456 length:432 start_codon:yes stop_codon:yes gene_type:complete